jgi:putative endonuclease
MLHFRGMQNTKTAGDEGEKIALEHLVSKGYRILETQWRWGKNEIDIIARRDHVVCFIEVKLRSSAWAGQPYEAVNKRKQQSIIRAANGYLKYNIQFDAEARFDVVSIVHNQTETVIDHLESAFYPML